MAGHIDRFEQGSIDIRRSCGGERIYPTDRFIRLVCGLEFLGEGRSWGLR
jgi:hypothetical protein